MLRAQWNVWTPFGWGLGIILGALVSYVDLHHSDVQTPALLVIVCAALLGFHHPRHAWQWALLIGLSVPIGDAVATANGYHAPYPPPSPRVHRLPAARLRHRRCVRRDMAARRDGLPSVIGEEGVRP